MSEPKFGMNYEDVRKRVKRISGYNTDAKAKGNLINSLLNQAERADKGARRELENELRHYHR